MFGGFGEPTAHPRILDMIGKVKALGVRVEMTTNGTLLDDTMLAGLIRNRLDRLWISFDAAEEARFETIRKGARFCCGGCTLVDENKEDCFGNTFPVCGACLWAQGVIQCP